MEKLEAIKFNIDKDLSLKLKACAVSEDKTKSKLIREILEGDLSFNGIKVGYSDKTSPEATLIDSGLLEEIKKSSKEEGVCLDSYLESVIRNYVEQ